MNLGNPYISVTLTSMILAQNMKPNIKLNDLLKCLFLQLPGRKGSGSGGWMIQAKLQIYLWLGSIKHKKNYPSGLPPGFQPTNELLNAERPGLPPPTLIHYSEKHVSNVIWIMYIYLKYNVIFFRGEGV